MFVHGVRDLQPVNECECRDILTAVGDLSQLVLQVADVGFEAISLPHHDIEKVVIVPLTLLARCVLGEERFGYLLEVAKRM